MRRQASNPCDCGCYHRLNDKCVLCGNDRPLSIDEPLDVTFNRAGFATIGKNWNAKTHSYDYGKKIT
jgi:hypothetical protein